MKKNSTLIFAFAWLLFGMLALITKDKIYWTDYGYLVLSLLYFGTYFYSKIKKNN